jgi:hypothetical protein
MDAERLFANRARITAVDIDASQAVAVSQPKPVADLIRSALCSVD